MNFFGVIKNSWKDSGDQLKTQPYNDDQSDCVVQNLESFGWIVPDSDVKQNMKSPH